MSMLAPVRWQMGEPRTRELPAPAPDHPAYEMECAVCPDRLGNGLPVVAVVIGPGAEPRDQDKCAAGVPFAAWAVLAHAACTAQDGAAS